MKAWRHFITITRHKILVMKGCFAVGLYKQGLLHDL
ncbi:MAG TPA: catalase, partial [Lachnospiraceae bacterium]|nr:catalase [Lachnospiraceae bacterium]